MEQSKQKAHIILVAHLIFNILGIKKEHIQLEYNQEIPMMKKVIGPH